MVILTLQPDLSKSLISPPCHPFSRHKSVLNISYRTVQRHSTGSTLVQSQFYVALCRQQTRLKTFVCHPYHRPGYSILSHNLGSRRGTTDEFATIPFHLDLFSAALLELAKSIHVHSCPLFDIVFPPLLLSASFSFSFHCAL